MVDGSHHDEGFSWVTFVPGLLVLEDQCNDDLED